MPILRSVPLTRTLVSDSGRFPERAIGAPFDFSIGASFFRIYSLTVVARLSVLLSPR
jgi:hypothetical protein